MRSCTAILSLILSILVSSARAQTVPRDDWHISVLTFGPGPVIHERYGHIAIRIKNDAGKLDVCYDWGNFSFDDPDFLLRFIKADTRYWMEGKDTRRMLAVYIGEWDRTVTEQTLNLTPRQADQLVKHISDQDDEAHRFYAYDFFKDNCATRVRDAVDVATDHALRNQLANLTTHSYRWQHRRIVPVGMTNSVLMTLMDLAMGPRIDAKLTRWEDGFLPGVLADELDTIRVTDSTGNSVPLVRERRVLNQTKTPSNAEPTTPTNPVWFTLPIGVVCSVALIFAAGRLPWAFKLGATVWEFFALIGMAFISGLTMFTRQWALSWNENLLQFTPLLLFVLPAIWFRSLRRALAWSALAAVGLSTAGLLVTISHLTSQSNASGVLLAWPLHVAVLIGLRRVARADEIGTDPESPRAGFTLEPS